MELVRIEAPPEFKAYPAYLREREENRRLYKKLSAALELLTLECHRRELRGEDVAHVRDFISRQRSELVQ